MELLKPKFKFGLYLVDTAKASYHNKNTPQQPVVCFAESYEIQGDGSIVFYQIVKNQEDKKVKIPVLAYPNGKWEACVLMDDQNDFPVFSYKNRAFVGNQSSAPVTYQSKSDDGYKADNTSGVRDDGLQLDEMFGTNIVSHGHQGGFNNHMGMPGINQNNPQEFKKQKEEWLEGELKSYLKNIDLFIVSDFLDSLKSNNQNKHFKAQEIEVIWACSKLIRNKQTMIKKFYDIKIQKILGLVLPDIMKRQWDGKMATILQVLQEREETKNANAIDLAVWMIQNNFQ